MVQYYLMKKHRNIVLVILFIFILIPMVASAAGFSISSNLTRRSLGGKIIRVGQTAEIACNTASGPIFVRPFNIATFGPFFTKDTTSLDIRANKQILANYKLIPDLKTCYNPETGAPIPAFEIKTYGISR